MKPYTPYDLVNIYIYKPPNGRLKRHYKIYWFIFISSSLVWDGEKLAELLIERLEIPEKHIERGRSGKVMRLWLKELPSIEQVESWCIDAKTAERLERYARVGIT